MRTAFLGRVQDSEMVSVLEDLMRDSLRSLLPVTVALAWIWALAVLFGYDRHTVTAYAVFASVLATVLGAYQLIDRHADLAAALYLACAICTVTLIALAFRGLGVLYLYLAILPIGATLGSSAVSWSLTVISIGLVAILGLCDPTLSPSALAAPILLLLFTGLIVWLSSRRFHTALEWALRMTAESQKNAADARERRGEVRSMLKSLDEAYARLERANEALIFAREAAERAYRFKAEFVANVSHELRTPLNLIVGFSEMMATAPESYKGTPLPSEYRGDVMAIYRSAKHLSALIDDVLDLSQIEVGKLPIHRELAELGDIIREAVEIVRGLAEAKNLRLEMEIPGDLPLLRLDRTRIRQVLLNLLTNATRFTDRGGIRVHACLDGSQVQVTVEDSGAGIDPAKIAEAFQTFSQLSEDEARRGTGLGLALSKRFVEMHGGTMWIESHLGKGTVVGFALPLPESGRDTPLTLLKSTPVLGQTARPRVLVLHDDPHILSLLDRYIEGYQFVPADSMAAATAVLQEGMPAAAIIDRDWRGQWTKFASGCQACARLPLVTLSLPSLRRLGLVLGATDYLAKPLTREQLLAALDRLPVQPRTVLIVDDDPSFIRLLTRMLQANDTSLRILEASGGEEGLAITRLEHPDLVFLDLVMPEVSGYDFLEALKRDADLYNTQVIILSAQAIEEEALPVMGGLHVERETGLSLAEVLQTLQAALVAVTASPGGVRANDGAHR